MSAKSIVSAQEKLERTTNALVKRHGVARAVEIIKAAAPTGLYKTTQNYPDGVFVYCDSEKGGVLVGTRQ